VRYMLLKLDANQNARLENDEVPKQMRPIFEILLERLDNNNDGQLDRQELSRSGPGLAQIAGRYVEREGIDVKAELAKLEKSQGAAAKPVRRQGWAAGAAGRSAAGPADV